jgi:RNA polymerase sigma-70 factor (ECF subfamily)
MSEAIVSVPGNMAASRPDRRLLTALRRGDPDAVRRLHAEHGDAVFGFLVATLTDRGAAEDVFQQVFVQAWQQAHRYDPARGGLRAWLLAIARSRALDHLRRRVPEPTDPATGRLALLEGEAAEPAVDALLEQWRLAELLDRLTAEERDLLRRRFYESRSQREIAEATGIPLGTVKMRMVGALRRLREMLEQEGEA